MGKSIVVEGAEGERKSKVFSLPYIEKAQSEKISAIAARLDPSRRFLLRPCGRTRL